MVHLFEWKWTDIARECREFLGPKGFAAVQVSPPNEHVVLPEYPWYQRYQPVSYKLESRSGTRAEFKTMVDECKAAGVDIYVDAVINHMSATLPPGETRSGNAGTTFGRYQYADYTYDDFHHCGRHGDDILREFKDRWEVQTCELLGLADLNTESGRVQSRIARYLNELIDLGVAGFRIDAAKHIPAQSLREILARVNNRAYIYQEVIDEAQEPIRPTEYLQNGDVTEFRYGRDLRRILVDGKLAWLNDKHRFGEGWGYLPSDKAIVFIDNHDNQRGHGGGGQVLTHKEERAYQLAAILMLSWPYGYPQVMSSYAFESTSQGPPSHQDGSTKSVRCLPQSQAASATEGWVCEHRWPVIANMVAFRNATAHEFQLTHWWTNGANQIAFGRGSSGFVVINHEEQTLDHAFKTGLKPGRYRNVATSDGGEPVIVDPDGWAHFQVRAHTAAAIHVGAEF